MARELTVEEMTSLDKYAEMFSRNVRNALMASLIGDINNSKFESYLGTKASITSLKTAMANPTTASNQKTLRQMSLYLYLVSPHYRRLISYYSTLPTFNYYVTPAGLTIKKLNNAAKKKYQQAYYEAINDCEKYNFKDELSDVTTWVLLEGVYCGIYYESDNAFYLKRFPTDFVKVYAEMDGVYRFAVDLDYFASRDYLFSAYGEDFYNAYVAYKGDRARGIKGDKLLKWYEPENQFCIKSDDDPTMMLPFFVGIFKEVLDLDDYRLLAKAKTEMGNYKVLAMQQDVDDNGVPKLDFELAKKYYDAAAQNLPEQVGLILSPFKIEAFTFDKSNVADTDDVNKAENQLWSATGTNPLLFGSTKITSANALLLSIKADEMVSYHILHKAERCFNLIQKLKGRPYQFRVRFLEQSIYSREVMQDALFKAATYGVPGAKSQYAASLGLSPAEVIGMSYLEDEVLEFTVSNFNHPMVSSHTQSSGSDPSNVGGRPTNESQGKTLTESGEADDDTGQNENAAIQ